MGDLDILKIFIGDDTEDTKRFSYNDEIYSIDENDSADYKIVKSIKINNIYYNIGTTPSGGSGSTDPDIPTGEIVKEMIDVYASVLAMNTIGAISPPAVHISKDSTGLEDVKVWAENTGTVPIIRLSGKAYPCNKGTIVITAVWTGQYNTSQSYNVDWEAPGIILNFSPGSYGHFKYTPEDKNYGYTNGPIGLDKNIIPPIVVPNTGYKFTGWEYIEGKITKILEKLPEKTPDNATTGKSYNYTAHYEPV